METSYWTFFFAFLHSLAHIFTLGLSGVWSFVSSLVTNVSGLGGLYRDAADFLEVSLDDVLVLEWICVEWGHMSRGMGSKVLREGEFHDQGDNVRN
jgi:hypothetical protein